MKPDLHITMNIDALDDSGKLKSEGGNIFLRRVFRSRLVEFTKTHPQVHLDQCLFLLLSKVGNSECFFL